MAETERGSERATIAECKNGRIIRVSGSYGETSHYFDACDELVGLEKTSDTRAACDKTSFTIAFGRTELTGCAVTERLAQASSPASGEPEIAAAAAALGAVSLASCPAPLEVGASVPASVHVTATFERDGRVVAARVDVAPGPRASCLESRVRLARIAPFAGSPVTIGTSYAFR